MDYPRPLVLTVNQFSYTNNSRQRMNSRHRTSIAKVFGLISFTFLCSLQALPVFSAVVVNYSYDDLNRLKTVTWKDGPVQKYYYDEVGNFTSQARQSPFSYQTILHGIGLVYFHNLKEPT